MDNTELIRIIAGVAAVVVLAIIVFRRRGSKPTARR